MTQPPRPCIDRVVEHGRGCPNMALPGKSRCAEHQAVALKTGTATSPGTTAAWRKARRAALERDGYRCTACGKSQEELRADRQWLECHHRVGSFRDAEHDVDDLVTLCNRCHVDVRRRSTRLTFPEFAAKVAAVRIRRE